MALRNQQIDDLENDLWRVRERHFLARTPTQRLSVGTRQEATQRDRKIIKEGWLEGQDRYATSRVGSL